MVETIPSTLHLIGFLTGMAALFIIELDLNITMRTDWDIFASRFFLVQEDTKQEVEYITYLITITVIAATTGHLLAIMGGFPTWVLILNLLSLLSLAAAVLEMYRLKKHLHVDKDD